MIRIISALRWVGCPEKNRETTFTWLVFFILFAALSIISDISALIVVCLLVAGVSFYLQVRKNIVQPYAEHNKLILWAMGAFLAYCCVYLASFCVNDVPAKSLWRMFLWLACLVAGYLASRVMPQHNYSFVKGLVIVLIASCIVGMGIEYSGIYGHSMFMGERLRLFTMHASRLGLYATCGVFFCVNGLLSAQITYQRMIWGGLVFLLMMIVYLSAARAIFFFSFVGILFLCLLRYGRQYKKIFIYFCVFGVISAAFLYMGRDSYYAQRVISPITNITEDSTFKSRLPIWEVGWEAFIAKPFLGQGPRSYLAYHKNFIAQKGQYLADKYPIVEQSVKQAHNIFLGRLAETGLLGAVTFFAFYVCSLWILCRAQPYNRWLGAFVFFYLLIGLFDDPLYRVGDSFVFILIGLGLGLPSRAEEK